MTVIVDGWKIPGQTKQERERRLEGLEQCKSGHDTRHYYTWLDEIDRLVMAHESDQIIIQGLLTKNKQLREELAAVQQEKDKLWQEYVNKGQIR